MAAAAASASSSSAKADGADAPVARAEDIAPSAFAASDASEAADLAVLGVKRPDDLDYDLANMTALDSHPVDASKLSGPGREKYLARLARSGVQLLLHRVFALPYEATPDGPMAVLPRPKLRLPRRLPVPEARAETKWERFAKEKGIKKKKRSRMVLDEQTGEWMPRWGYKRANDDTKDWAIPAKAGEGDDANPFLERELKKKERTLKNKVKHLKNMERAERAKGGSAAAKSGKHRATGAAEAMAAFAAAGTPVGIAKTVSAAEGDVSGVHGQGRQKRPRPSGESKDEKTKRVKAAQAATASMGRFDRRLPGEPEPPRDPVRHKKRAATPAGAGEHSRDMAVLSAVVHGAGSSKGKRGKKAGKGASGSREFRRDRSRK